jgi:hypothetical protein
MRVIAIALLLFAACHHPAFADENPHAGTWKLNPERSRGPVPACVQNGVLKIKPEIYTGSPKPALRSAAAPGPSSAKCAGVYRFAASPDGHTLTMTQPQVDPKFIAVFEKQ